MVVNWRRSRLHEEDVFAPNWLAKLYHHLAVGEPVDRTGTDRYAQLTCDRRSQERISCACKNRKRVAHAYLRLLRPGRIAYGAIVRLLAPPRPDCCRPQIPYLPGQDMFNVLNLSFADPVREYVEHCPGDLLRIERVGSELLVDTSQELLSMTLFQRLCSRMPTLVIEASD